ncbi:DMT family transporter [Streptomyces griseiscabiei]|uniref:DMT family transporter n=1 Tax=Streptomyces griseiscabiei TaxID=2993540 RepID=A0ABU4KYT8_9ACTN|nr:DMT family transporter [Streptomyces griseiscabiei]MBZ3904808.1 DMT family transporter [Streptomyces griseiscabiei]MDX2908561.1 DMT family transporter [Streptomyces griseiscabiei]
MNARASGAYGWLLFTMVLWGSAFPSSKYAVEHVPHEVAALFRFGGGAAVLLLMALFQRPRQAPPLKAVIGACVAGLVGVFGYNALFFWGVTMAPASDGGVMFPALTPVITTVVLILAGRESARPVRVLGLVIGAGGAALFFVTTTAHGVGGPERLMGDTVFLVGAAVWSVYTLLNRKLVVGMDPLQAVMYSTVAGSLALAVMAAPEFGEVRWSGLPTGFWINAVHLAIGPTAVAYLLYVRGIRDVGASTASVMMFAVPLFSTLFSFLFLGESFTWAQSGSALLMLGGAFIAVISGHGSAGKKAAGEAEESADDEVDEVMVKAGAR